MSASAPPDIPGLVYVQPVGSGGYADVFLYQQQMPRMRVAVKVLKAEGLTAAIRRQFSDEADTMAQLADHPYIVDIFRSETSSDGRPYLVMKYYPPPNLAMRARSERFSVEEVLRTGIQLASAVETAHRAGITHRDIKPANVLVSQYGTPGLTDFGIAGRGATIEDDDDDVGVSVPWAAPEVLFGQSSGDARADVYSLGATLWQLLVGRSPFEIPGGDNTAYGLMPRIRSNPVPPTGRADVPQSLERLLSQTMSKEPASRPASAMELARGLQAIEQEQRFAATRIVVLDEKGHTTLADQHSTGGLAEDVDATRVRAPQAVQAQAPLPPPVWGTPAPMSGGTSIPPVVTAPGTTPSPWAASASPVDAPAAGAPAPSAYAPSAYAPSTYAAPGSDLADEGTVQVNRAAARAATDAGVAPAATPAPATRNPGSPVSAPPPGTLPTPEPERSGGGRGGLIALVGVLVVALVGVVVFLVVRPDGTEEADEDGPVATQTVGGGDEPIVTPLTAPAVTATSVAGRVAFAWTYPDRQKGDTYRIAFGVDSGQIDKTKYQELTTTNFSQAVAKGAMICAQVRTIRSGAQSEWSVPKCERAG